MDIHEIEHKGKIHDEDCTKCKRDNGDYENNLFENGDKTMEIKYCQSCGDEYTVIDPENKNLCENCIIELSQEQDAMEMAFITRKELSTFS